MAYSRYIYIGGKLKSNVDTCTFSWDRDHGCTSATLTLQGVPFDTFDGIDAGDFVDIRYDTSVSTRWWYGIVDDLQTELGGVLTVEAVGMYTLLEETFPTGRFGKEVETKQIDTLSSSSETTGGELAAGTYTYSVSCLDADGETLAYEDTAQTVAGGTSTITVTWEQAQNATGYRVYRYDGSSYVYFDTSELSFLDDGSNAGTSIAALPVANTAITPTISGTDAQTVVKYLLSNFLSSSLTYSAAQITAGSDTELDDYNLNTSSSSLYDVLRTLALQVGDVAWGVDEDGVVFFKPIGTSVSEIFRVGREYGSNGKVAQATRRKSRNGVTSVKVEGEEAAEDTDTNMGPTQAANNPELYTDPEPVVYQSGPIAAYRKNDLSRVFTLQINVAAGLELWGSISSFPTISPRTVDFFKDGASLKTEADLKNWFYFIPGLYDVWRELHTSWKYADRHVAAMLVSLSWRLTLLKHRYAKVGSTTWKDSPSRRRQAGLHAPGVTTRAAAQIVAANYLAKYTPTPEVWSIKVIGAEELIKPGINKIRLITQQGRRYDLEVQTTNYSFGDAVELTISAGDLEYTEEVEKEETKRVVTKVSARHLPKNVWKPYTP